MFLYILVHLIHSTHRLPFLSAHRPCLRAASMLSWLRLLRRLKLDLDGRDVDLICSGVVQKRRQCSPECLLGNRLVHGILEAKVAGSTHLQNVLLLLDTTC